jgi:Mg2+ and Co2+ transporter CorA
MLDKYNKHPLFQQYLEAYDRYIEASKEMYEIRDEILQDQTREAALLKIRQAQSEVLRCLE